MIYNQYYSVSVVLNNNEEQLMYSENVKYLAVYRILRNVIKSLFLRYDESNNIILSSVLSLKVK